MKKFSARYTHFLFAFFLSLIMSCIVSGVSVLKTDGLEHFMFANWMQAWGASWLVAFPCVLVIAPFVRKLVAAITQQ